MMQSFSLTIMKSSWRSPALRQVSVASVMCSPVAQLGMSDRRRLARRHREVEVLHLHLAGTSPAAGPILGPSASRPS